MGSIPPDPDDMVKSTADYVLIQRRYNDQSKEIEKLIDATLREILDEMITFHKYFKVSELLKVGSFKEGTKISKPNEFDYIAVLEHFSKPGLLKVVDNEDNPGIVRLKVNEAHNKDGKWDPFIQDGYLRCVQLDEQTMNYANFGKQFINAVYRLKYNQKNRPDGGNLIWSYVKWFFGANTTKFFISNMEVNSPNVLLEFEIGSMKVSVDLSPALRCSNVRSCFQPEDCFSPNIARSVLNRGSILLVGQSDDKFKVTFTETEVDYLNNEMSPKHKKLYIYLKYVAYLINKQVKSDLFPSYTLKLACIKHDVQCLQTGTKILPCLRKVLIDYVVACYMLSLPSVFNKQLDIMKSSEKFSRGIDERNHYILCLINILELAAEAKSPEEHKADLKRMVCQYGEMYQVICSLEELIWEIVTWRLALFGDNPSPPAV